MSNPISRKGQASIEDANIRVFASIDDPSEKLVNAARVALMLRQPFLGHIVAGMDLREASGRVKTAATNGRDIFYNAAWMSSLTSQERIFVLAHEVLHAIMFHVGDLAGRIGNRDADYWNMACDYIVNYILVRDQIGSMPEIGLWRKDYTDDYSVEALYDIIAAQGQKRETLDRHITVLEGDGAEEVGPFSLTAEEAASIKEQTLSAYMLSALSAGNAVPESVKKLIGQLYDPEMDWQTLLEAKVRSLILSVSSYKRPSRRDWGNGFILPGKDAGRMIKAFIAIDTSASTTAKMVTKFVSESVGIMTAFRNFELTIFCFDVGIYDVVVLRPDNLDDIYSYEPRGDGGTHFECIFDYLRNNEIVPDTLVIFTDGLPNATWGDPSYCDTLFVIHSNAHITAPYGRTAHFRS